MGSNSKKSRPDILKSLYIAHQGIRKTRDLASQFYYGPKIMNKSEQMINNCEECNVRPSKRNEPLIQTKGDYPFHKTSPREGSGFKRFKLNLNMNKLIPLTRVLIASI